MKYHRVEEKHANVPPKIQPWVHAEYALQNSDSVKQNPLKLIDVESIDGVFVPGDIIQPREPSRDKAWAKEESTRGTS